MTLEFEKWQALGNDYIIVEEERLPFELTAERVRRICEGHFGCHSDGVLLLARDPDERFEASLRIFNPDGSEAELSGNGAREAVLYLRRSGWTSKDRFSIRTAAGEITPTIVDERTCSIAIGHATLRSPDFPAGAEDGMGELDAGGQSFRFRHVNVGNPQCVIDVGDELQHVELARVGPEIERHELFPNRTNVSFIQVKDADVKARIWERGVGETLASGTGACGAAVAAVLAGGSSPVRVTMAGGTLEVEVADDLGLTLTGWAEPVFRGAFSSEFVASLEGRS
jgi:diaminopimelate epimerase